jgi:hypothetical protein
MSVLVNDTLIAQITESHERILAEALDQALIQLQKPRCAEIFGPSAPDALRTANFRFISLGKPQFDRTGRFFVVNAKTILSARMIVINLDGSFVNPKLVSGPLGSDFGLTPVKYRALILLHELGHLVGVFKPDVGVADPTSNERSRQYSAMIRSKCF